MIAHRLLKAAAVTSLAALVFVSSACGSSETETNAGSGTVADANALLGAPNETTGPPIKIGFINDGKSAGIDHTPVIGAFNAAVQYANEHLGGINGHEIQVDECSTNNTPSDATTCGVKMVNDKVAAVLVPVSAQDNAVYNAMKNAGIPYFTYAAGSQDVIVGSNTFLLANPLATQAAQAKLAKESNFSKAGIIIVDVPAATGPLQAIAQPIYDKAGVGLDVIPISQQTADMTPQIQQALATGAQQFTVIGADEFNTSAIKALKQLGFTGKIVLITPPTPQIVDNVPGGLGGVVYITSSTSDADDRDVQLYNAVLETYMKDVEPSAQSSWAFATVIAFVNALQGDTSAVDAPTVSTALKSMPKPQALPLGGGLTYQCGAKVVALIPNVCTANVLWTTLDSDGHGQTYEVLDVSDYLAFGA